MKKNYKRKFPKICVTCGKDYEGVHNQIYCAQTCSPYIPTYPGLSPATVGAIGELRVCADLLAKGFSVFRAVSPACPCDLIALKNNKILRIEVRTGAGSTKGFTFRRELSDAGKQDHFAVIVKDSIVYLPVLGGL